MDAGVRAVLALLMRWVHISSVVALIGGFFYARLAVWPALQSLGPAQSSTFVSAMVSKFRGWLYTILFTAFASGLYNYLTKPFYPPHYHMWFGIKFLFVLHIFAVAILYASPTAEMAKRRRWLTGLVISGFIVIAISAYLRWLTLNVPVRP